eukprot:1161464-Pelagomonas_calceolata.AAC.6
MASASSALEWDKDDSRRMLHVVGYHVHAGKLGWMDGPPLSSNLSEKRKSVTHQYAESPTVQVYRVGDLDKTIEYYKKHFGMQLLRMRDVPEVCACWRAVGNAESKPKIPPPCMGVVPAVSNVNAFLSSKRGADHSLPHAFVTQPYRASSPTLSWAMAPSWNTACECCWAASVWMHR